MRRAGPRPVDPGPRISGEMRDHPPPAESPRASCGVGQEGGGTLFRLRDTPLREFSILFVGIPRPPDGSAYLLRCHSLRYRGLIHRLVRDEGIDKTQEAVADGSKDFPAFEGMGMRRTLAKRLCPSCKVWIMPKQGDCGNPEAPAESGPSFLTHRAVGRPLAGRLGLRGIGAG